MNLYLSKNDYYNVYLNSLITNEDIKSLVTFYQPILKSNAIMLYMTLLNEVRYQEWTEVSTLELLSIKTGLTLSDIMINKSYLEAIGLIKTYRKIISDDNSSYIFMIYAPKTPDEFVNDNLLSGLLISVVGDKIYSRLKRIYKLNKPDLKEYTDASCDFKTMFSEYKFKLIPESERIFGRKIGDVSYSFDEYKLLDNLKNNGVKSTLFNNEELTEIKRIATLFSLDETTIAKLVSLSINNGEFDIEKLNRLCKAQLVVPVDEITKSEDIIYDEDKELARKINLMNSTSPIDYLRLITSMANPSPADIASINNLSKVYGLSFGAINAIVEYTLNACNMDLPRPYLEKLASKMQRSKIKDAMEAINLLKGKRKNNKKTTIKEESVVKEDKPNESNDNEDITIDDLLKAAEGL